MMISFILLCYNQEVEIMRAIKSIIFSGIPREEYEIIVVDDGSVDNSVNVMNKSGLVDLVIPMIKNTKNQSLCRNTAIKKSKSKYLMFCDGDDYYNSLELFQLYNESKDLEFDMFFSSALHMESEVLFHSKITKNILFNMEDMIMELDHGTQSYIVSRDFIKKNNLYFDEIKYNYDSEDLYFTYRLLDSMKIYYFSYNQNYLYTHLLYDGNNTSCKYKNPNYLKYMEDMYSDLQNLLINKNIKNLLDIFYIREIKRVVKNLGGNYVL